MCGSREDGVLDIGTGEVLARTVALGCSELSCTDPEPAFGLERTGSLVLVLGRALALELWCSSVAAARARSVVVINFERSSARVAALAVWAGVLVPFNSDERELTATKPEEGDTEARVPLGRWGEYGLLEVRASDSRRAMMAFLRFFRRWLSWRARAETERCVRRHIRMGGKAGSHTLISKLNDMAKVLLQNFQGAQLFFFIL